MSVSNSRLLLHPYLALHPPTAACFVSFPLAHHPGLNRVALALSLVTRG